MIKKGDKVKLLVNSEMKEYKVIFVRSHGDIYVEVTSSFWVNIGKDPDNPLNVKDLR